MGGRVGQVGEVGERIVWKAWWGRGGLGHRWVGDGELKWQQLYGGGVSGTISFWGPGSTSCPAYAPWLSIHSTTSVTSLQGLQAVWVGLSGEPGPYLLDSVVSVWELC